MIGIGDDLIRQIYDVMFLEMFVLDDGDLQTLGLEINAGILTLESFHGADDRMG